MVAKPKDDAPLSDPLEQTCDPGDESEGVFEVDDKFDSGYIGGNNAKASSTSLDSEDVKVSHSNWQEWIILKEEYTSRRIWDFVVAMLLFYTATAFPYRLCFIDLFLPKELRYELGKEYKDERWKILEGIVDWLFIADLFISFFFTYRDEGVEVCSWCRIVKNYLKTYFVINLLACLPETMVSEFITLISGDGSEVSGNQAFRIIRLPTGMSRLLRMVRLIRLAKMKSFMDRSWLYGWIKENVAGFRLLNFVSGLLVTAHLMACGWYLVAVMDHEESETWVARRAVDSAGDRSLLDERPMIHWLHAFYFIFTVFTTVGFGDMSAMRPAEIVYVIITMVVGTVVNSIVVSEMIGIVTNVDDRQRSINRQKALIEGFKKHAELPEVTVRQFHEWLDNAPFKGEVEFDREGMQELISGGKFPRELIGELPENIFHGKLLKNHLLTVCRTCYNREVPPRFVVILSVLLHRQFYQDGETIYHVHDHPFTVFIVLTGTFGFFAVPTKYGGKDEAPLRIPKILTDDSGSKKHASSAVIPKSVTEAIKGTARTPRQAKLSRNGSSSVSLVSKQYPYKTFGPGSYFGDYEVLGRLADENLRKTSARCCYHGSVLLLLKKDLGLLESEFPQYYDMWRTAARRREAQRLRFLARHTMGFNAQALAARRIQDAVRHWRKSRQNIVAESTSPVAYSTPVKNSDNVAERTPTTPLGHLKQQAINLGNVEEQVTHLRDEMREHIQGVRHEMRSCMRDIRQELKLNPLRL